MGELVRGPGWVAGLVAVSVLVVPAGASTGPAADGVRVVRAAGMSALSYAQRVAPSAPMVLPTGSSELVVSPAAALPPSTVGALVHGGLTVGLSSAVNPVFASDESVIGRRLYPALWVRKGSTGVVSTVVAGDPAAASVILPGDSYAYASTKFQWPVASGRKPAAAGARRGSAVMDVLQTPDRKVGYATAAGSQSATATVVQGMVRAVGGAVDGRTKSVLVSRRLPLATRDAVATTLLLGLTVSSPGAQVRITRMQVTGTGKNAALTVEAGISGVLGADTVEPSSGIHSNAATFMVLVLQGGLHPISLPASMASIALESPQGADLTIGVGDRVRRLGTVKGSTNLMLPLTPEVPAAEPDGGSYGCYFSVEQNAGSPITGTPVSARGRTALRGGAGIPTQVGTLTPGVVTVDGVAYELTSATAETRAIGKLPPWEIPLSTGPISPILTSDTVGSFLGSCKFSDRTTQADPSYDAYGAVGGTSIHQVWQAGPVVVESVMQASSSARQAWQDMPQLLQRIRVVSRDGARHLVAISGALLDVTAPILTSVRGAQEGPALTRQTYLPENVALSGIQPMHLTTPDGPWEIAVSSEAARPDGAGMDGRYAGTSTTIIQARGSAYPTPWTASLDSLDKGSDIIATTGAPGGLGPSTYYASLLMRASKEPRFGS